LEIEGLPRNRIHGLDITMSMLRHAKKRFESIEYANGINHVCASAMEIPYVNGIFSKVICGLASHHMNAKILASESYRVLSQEGTLSIIDAGGSLLWKIPGVKLIIKLAAFVYFSLAENNSRAWLEADAVSNVISKDEWVEVLAKTGFQNIEIVKLSSKYFWVPAPLLIKALKTNGGRSIEQLV
jgi:ubiquinone/menaquinone biosynthesis C-methylase UbiE